MLRNRAPSSGHVVAFSAFLLWPKPPYGLTIQCVCGPEEAI